jgi:small subunit ribosomal protein S14
MAKKSVVARSKKKPKYSSRIVRRCWRCGRKRGYMRKFNLCRICFRELANKNEIPGLTKSSW